MLTNYRHMAISCSRTATHTTSWVARASRCPVDPWENKNRSNGGITSWQPRRKPPRKRNTKRIMLVQKFPKASREKHLLRGFSGAVHAQPLFLRRWSLSSAAAHHPELSNLSSDWEGARKRRSRQLQGRPRNRDRTYRWRSRPAVVPGRPRRV